ncbi:hypothetical protein BGZ74_003596 [Mortierella antarctica]|nr:hypothetical protein BGZ74_003596 [Mortierella antarctica]
MASPHVAGVAALYLSFNSIPTAQGLFNKLTQTATLNKITGNLNGSPNRLVFNGADTATLAVFEPALNEIARRHNGTSITVNHRYDTFLSLIVTTSNATTLQDVVTSAQIASLEQDAVATAQSS